MQLKNIFSELCKYSALITAMILTSNVLGIIAYRFGRYATGSGIVLVEWMKNTVTGPAVLGSTDVVTQLSVYIPTASVTQSLTVNSWMTRLSAIQAFLLVLQIVHVYYFLT